MTRSENGRPAVRLPRAARRAQLLKAASSVFAEVGYHQAAMDDIADEAGVSKPVLYQHFASKLELYLALLDHATEELVVRVAAAMSSSTNNKDRVYGAVRAYFDFVDNDSDAYRLLYQSDLRNDPQVDQIAARGERGAIDAIAQAIAEDTQMEYPAAHLLTVAVIGASEASARGWLSGTDYFSRSDATELVASLLWRGISGFPAKRP